MKEYSFVQKNWNPQDSANWLSKIFFSYHDRTFIKSYKNYLTENDLHDTRPCDRAHLLHANLNKHYKMLKQTQSKTKGNFMKAIVYMMIRSMLILFPLPIFEEILKLGQAVILGQLLRYFTGDISVGMAYTLAVLLALCCFLPGLLHHNFFYILQAMGMRVRVAACSMIYRKLLGISSCDFFDMSTGKAVNLISSDVTRYDLLFLFAPYFIIAPFQLLIVTIFCWFVIGWYCIPGIALLLLIGIVLLITPRLYRYLRKKTAMMTDLRLLYMSELLNAIKIIKSSCWEDHFSKMVASIRRKEIKRVLCARLLEAITPSIATPISKFAVLVIILCFLFVTNYMPTSSQVYEIITAISPTRITILILLPLAYRMSAESWVSSRRIEQLLQIPNKFLSYDTEKTDKSGTVVSIGVENVSIDVDEHDDIVIAKDVSMQWNRNDVSSFNLHNLSFQIKKGQLVAVVGSVGCGKSSLLYALLGEMFQIGGVLKKNGTVSFSSQDPWLFNGSLRQNVLFGSELDKNRLREVYNVTSLNQDLQMISGKDMVQLGDKGVGLSGGQKSRVSLARAIYRDADCYLLDEPLGALDARTRESVFINCIKTFLKDKTVLLVTHQIQFLDQCDWIIILNQGQIIHQGTYSEMLTAGIDFSMFTLSEEDKKSKQTDAAKELVEVTVQTHKRTLTERNQSAEILNITDDFLSKESTARGDVGASVYMQYFHAGARNWFNIVLVLLLLVGTIVVFVLADWWLAKWLYVSDSINRTNSRIDSINSYYLKGYIGLTVGSLLCSILRCVAYVLCVVNSSKVLHNEMFTKILHAPLHFFSINPIGIILNRFSKDVGAMDDIIPQMIQDALECGMLVAGLLIYISIVNPYTLIVIIPYIVAAWLLRNVYLKCSQEVKRIEAITRTPVFAHLNNTLLGLQVIRAFGMEEMLIKEFEEHLDHNTKAFNMFLTTQKWFQLRLEIVSSLFVLMSTFTFIGLGNELNISTSQAGLSISYAITMLGLFQWAVRQSAETVSHIISVERVLEYSKLEPEVECSNPFDPGDDWLKSSAALEMKDMSFQYSKDSDIILKNVNLSISNGEKVHY
ncbi:hypothetical protein GJ496_010434 [Pomphorhynchus laevis]|nr:hypothetical protein GJ496_010434 [Pomphorhynchus laevis]